ncbi:hypothetical protein H8356DRAFT_966853 [Neocallimastix lanati (nom. inval.)]|uniref:Uncharacterized protein n=1 Tax=Neocallimastix californiae TaxID=1754190 RepID=A0A1Y2C6K0_9FUNG|nr:hypothetical protein H8356DRAFT_966853 [Neocallimastix sp. JGI-2020a]ORY42669.1 hypothetical protein LY90DRAFT_509938 [Neocallimastix californiae]|eukprot:ORY42669.1 hypothetical protein LY90DRAFT_509938 [Neocallimastix californiae]
MIQKKTYFISLVRDSYEIQIPTPIDGVFIVDGIEKVIISQELFCPPIFIYKYDCIEYKECNKKGKFQSFEIFTDYKYIEYLLRVKEIKSHEKQSISLVCVLRYLKPEFSLSKIKQIIIENVIGKNIPEDIEIKIPDSEYIIK